MTHFMEKRTAVRINLNNKRRKNWIEVELGKIGNIIKGNASSKANPLCCKDKIFLFYKPTDLENPIVLANENIDAGLLSFKEIIEIINREELPKQKMNIKTNREEQLQKPILDEALRAIDFKFGNTLF